VGTWDEEMVMKDEEIVTLWFVNDTPTGRVLCEIGVPAYLVEALDRDAVPTFRALAHRRFEGKDAQKRIQAWVDKMLSG
jgi:hypothetical protein